jgi:hypothetical protein
MKMGEFANSRASRNTLIQQKDELWALLQYLATLPPELWLCMWDFNKILEHGKKWGGGKKS